MTDSRICREQSCDRLARARGLCSRHYQRNRAAGTLPPVNAPYAAHLADQVDDVVVDRLVAGVRPPRVTSFERREAVRRLMLAGLPVSTVCLRLRVDGKQVRRDLAKVRQVAA